MLEKEDLKQIRQIVREEFSEGISSAEKRITSEIITAVGDLIDDAILPQLDKLNETKADKADILRLENKIDKLAIRVDSHEKDILQLKSHLNK